MKIGLVAEDFNTQRRDILGRPIWSGPTWVRLAQYSDHFKEMGVDHRCGMLGSFANVDVLGVVDASGKAWFDCDVIVLQRYMDDKLKKDMLRGQAAGQIFINDVDDWYWGLSKKNAAYGATDPSRNRSKNRNIYAEIISMSDGVIASTPFLQEKLRHWNDRTLLHGNYVDLKRFKKYFKHEDKEKIVVGWVGSMIHRSGDLDILRPHVKDIGEFASWHHTGHIPHAGYPKFHSELGIAESDVTYFPFQNPQSLMAGINFDVGIVPLVNIPFNHAKSYVKGIEYAAANVPFVASWSPQYQQLSEEHGIGVVVSKASEYVSELKKFCDFDYRQEVAEANRNAVQAFDTKLGAVHLYECIQEIVRQVRP